MAEWVHIFLRSIGAIAMLFLLTRILGKKQISQLTFFEYITGIALGELAGFISTDLEAHYMLGIVALLTWTFIPLFLELMTLKSKKMRNWFEGKGTVLIKEGKVLEDNLKRERFSSDELLEQLRVKNVFNVTDVEFAVLEASGDLSVLLKKENQPLTAKHLGVQTGPEQESQTVIMDGNVLDEPLATFGLNRSWLFEELDKQGVSVNNVYLGQVDSYGQLYIDTFDDSLKLPQNSSKPALLASLKKCEADLELFSLTTDNEEAKGMFDLCASRMRHVLRQTTPLLKR